ncbi:hypothetical protein QSI_1137 [Clostridioides difficile P28]|nr:hypothetical protein QSI_1137 [Clostridioides difficile P28]
MKQAYPVSDIQAENGCKKYCYNTWGLLRNSGAVDFFGIYIKW